MGLAKSIVVTMIILLVVAMLYAWFPEQTKEILDALYVIGIMMLKLIGQLFKKMAVVAWDWIQARK